MRRECCCCWSKDIFAECEDAEEMLKLSDLIGDTFIIRYLCKKHFDTTNVQLEEMGYKEKLTENNGKWRMQ